MVGRFSDSALSIDRDLEERRAVLDGEIVCLDGEGPARFYDLVFGRGIARFVAFDVLALEDRDLRERPLHERKKILRRFIPRRSPFILFADAIDGREDRTVCARDFEEIVAK
jgi:bifunctional non-homologous end joining protein LigD